MQVNISGHQLEVTEPLRTYIGEKLERLERHFDKITNVQVTMTVEKLKQKIEATLHIPGMKWSPTRSIPICTPRSTHSPTSWINNSKA